MRGGLVTLVVATVLLAGVLSLALASPAVSQAPTLGIKASIVPTRLPADGGIYQAIFVQLVAPNGNVAAAPQDYSLFVTSSNENVGTAQSPMLIRAGQTFGSETFTTTNTPGVTTITISGNGLTPVSMPLSTYAVGSKPSRLAVFIEPPVLVSDGSSTYFIFVQTQDVNGTPARADQTLTVVTTSSAPNIISVQPTMTIPQGGSYASSTLTAGTDTGNATITAQLNGFQSTTTVVSGIYLPLDLSLATNATGTILSGSDVPFTLTATSSGVPVQAALVSWSTSSHSDSFVTESAGTNASGMATAKLHLLDSGNISVTAQFSANGYGTRTLSKTISVKSLTLGVQLIPSSLTINASQASDVSALVTSNGKPVAGAQVTWSSTMGLFTPPQSSTDATGIATASLTSISPGNATVTATASDTGYAPGTSTVTIQVVLPPVHGGFGTLAEFFALFPGPTLAGMPDLLIALIVVVFLAILLLVMRGRIRAPPAEEEEGEEVPEEETMPEQLTGENLSDEDVRIVIKGE